jgi:hypothetical protein
VGEGRRTGGRAHPPRSARELRERLDAFKYAGVLKSDDRVVVAARSFIAHG